MCNLKIQPNFKEKLKIKRGLHKIAKLDRMNTRFQRGAVEITLDLLKGLSQIYQIICYTIFITVEITLDLFKGFKGKHQEFMYRNNLFQIIK